MSAFQVMVVTGDPAPADGGAATSGGAAGGAPTPPDARVSSLAGDRVIAGIDELGDVWDTVIGRLTALAAQSRAAAEGSDFELSTIEFNLGVEAGLNIGFVTRGEASVSVTFARTVDGRDA